MPRIAQPITLESADRRELERWVAAHTTPQPVTQRCRLHFIPTTSSWLNLVERWFGELTGKRIRRGSL